MAKPTVEVNFFKPSTPNMRKEVRIASIVLLVWAFLSFGLPLMIWLFGLGDPTKLGRSWMTEVRFIGFPLHYWLLAQGCTIGYVLLCKLYCFLWEKRISRPRRPIGSGGPGR